MGLGGCSPSYLFLPVLGQDHLKPVVLYPTIRNPACPVDLSHHEYLSMLKSGAGSWINCFRRCVSRATETYLAWLVWFTAPCLCHYANPADSCQDPTIYWVPAWSARCSVGGALIIPIGCRVVVVSVQEFILLLSYNQLQFPHLPTQWQMIATPPLQTMYATTPRCGFVSAIQAIVQLLLL